MVANENIKLRALEPDDVDLLYMWENDPETWRVSNTHMPVSKFLLASYIKSCNKDFWESKEMRLIIETPEGKPVGSLELFDFDPYHMRAGLGIIIFEKDDRQKGIASKALQLIMEYACNELGIFQLYVNVAESNRPSIELFKKLEFETVGLKKNWLKIQYGWEGEFLFQKILGPSI